MKKGKLIEEDIVKISITARRAGEAIDNMKILAEVDLLEKLMAKKRRGKSN